jgi:hypothetical protein
MKENIKECFARIIELPGYQVLIYIEDDKTGENIFRIVQESSFEGTRVKLSLGYSHDEYRGEYFLNYSEKNAQIFIDSINDLLND